MKKFLSFPRFAASIFLVTALPGIRPAAAQTWTPQTTSTTSNVAAIHFPTENIGYIAAGTSILKTTNGGANWANIYTDWTYLSLFFVNKDTGWAAGNGGDVRKTTNGGTVWVNQTNNGGGTNQLDHIVFTSPLKGFGARNGNNGGTGNIIRTTNGGANWLLDTIGLTTGGIRKFQFLTPAIGYAVGRPAVFKTIDSGNTWTQASGTIPTTSTIHAVKFVTPDIGYVAGQFGEIFKTTNGGTGWTKVLTGAFNEIGDITWNSLECLDANTCFASGNGSAYMVGGYVYRTNNGGATWEQNLNLNPGVINGLTFPSAAGGYFIGNTGVVRKSGAVVAVSPDAGAAGKNSLSLTRAAGGWNLGYRLASGGIVTVSVLDLSGRLVWSTVARGTPGQNNLSIPADKAAPGLHLLDFRGEGIRHSLKLGTLSAP